MAYPTYTEVAAYLLYEGYATAEISDAKAQRLLAAAIGEWDGLVGVVPFLAASRTQVFDPRDIQADRRGWILDLPNPIADYPTEIRSSISPTSAGEIFTLYVDYEMPAQAFPVRQIVFLTKPLNRLSVTAPFGVTTSPGTDVADAIYSLCAARFVQEGQGATGVVEMEQTGLVKAQYATSNGIDVYARLHERAQKCAQKYIPS